MTDILLVCDMDGTLLNSKSLISDENIAAIESFIADGGRFSVATGRSHYSVARYLPRLPINIPSILFNGAMIYDFSSNKIVRENNITGDSADQIKEMLSQFPDVGIEIYHGDDIYIVTNNSIIDDHVAREYFEPIYCAINDVPEPWIKVIIAAEPGRLKDVEKQLKSQTLPYRFTYSETVFIELLHHDATKGHALIELAKLFGVSPDKVIAVGDNLNDMEMITQAGVGIAVGNAHPELKKIADICGKHHDEHAVAHVIEWIRANKYN